MDILDYSQRMFTLQGSLDKSSSSKDIVIFADRLQARLFKSTSIWHANLGLAITPGHNEAAQPLRRVLERLIIDLVVHYHANLETKKQDLALRLARKLLRLNKSLHQGNEVYTWQGFCIEQRIGEKLAQQLLNLKALLPREWSNRVRSAVREFAKVHADYLAKRRKELGQLH